MTHPYQDPRTSQPPGAQPIPTPQRPPASLPEPLPFAAHNPSDPHPQVTSHTIPTPPGPQSTVQPPARASATPPVPKRNRLLQRVAPIALAAALTGAAGVFVGVSVIPACTSTTTIIRQVQASTPTPALPAVTAAPSNATPLGASTLDASQVASQVVPSIVTVEVGSGEGYDFTRIASGSGVVLDEDGHIVTNDHVAAAGPDIQVVLSDGRVYEAELVGTDPVTDLAVLRVDAENLTPITLGSTDDLQVGTSVVAVGNPLGLEGGPSLSAGVVSALGREVQTDPETILYGMIQTDAPITSGSSGGSLVDANGDLLGITTAVGVSSIGVEGIGFATTVEVVQRVVDEIITSGSASHALLGITGMTRYDETSDGGFAPVGVEIDKVTPDSPADVAGLAPGDIITAVDSVPVRTMDELISVLRRHSAADTVTISVADTDTVVAVTLADRTDYTE